MSKTQQATSSNTKLASWTALVAKLGNKSRVIRYLAAQGMKPGDMVRHAKASGVDIRYQHCRNVMITPIKRPE